MPINPFRPPPQAYGLGRLRIAPPQPSSATAGRVCVHRPIGSLLWAQARRDVRIPADRWVSRKTMARTQRDLQRAWSQLRAPAAPRQPAPARRARQLDALAQLGRATGALGWLTLQRGVITLTAGSLWAASHSALVVMRYVWRLATGGAWSPLTQALQVETQRQLQQPLAHWAPAFARDVVRYDVWLPQVLTQEGPKLPGPAQSLQWRAHADGREDAAQPCIALLRQLCGNDLVWAQRAQALLAQDWAGHVRRVLARGPYVHQNGRSIPISQVHLRGGDRSIWRRDADTLVVRQELLCCVGVPEAPTWPHRGVTPTRFALQLTVPRPEAIDAPWRLSAIALRFGTGEVL